MAALDLVSCTARHSLAGSEGSSCRNHNPTNHRTPETGRTVGCSRRRGCSGNLAHHNRESRTHKQRMSCIHNVLVAQRHVLPDDMRTRRTRVQGIPLMGCLDSRE